MRLETETYTVTSYEEMMEARNEAEESAKKYKQAYKNYLITCLCKAGFADKKVKRKRTGVIGFLKVAECSFFHAHEIKFYPLTKDGNISKVAKYHGYYHEDRLVEELVANFELVGDENAG